jgi:hypothetical protein
MARKKAPVFPLVKKKPTKVTHLAIRAPVGTTFDPGTSVLSVEGSVGTTTFSLDFDPSPHTIDSGKTIIVKLIGELISVSAKSGKSKPKSKREVAPGPPDPGNVTITLSTPPTTIDPITQVIPVVFVDDHP